MDEVIHSEAALSAAVHEAIANTKVLDVHTHLFPASHGDLMLWGIDALLTYHYLVSEFFVVAPDSISHKNFFSLHRSEQADLVWEHLFVRRLPLSEAALGIVTSLNALGLQEQMRARDLDAIRKWFLRQDKSKHIQRVFALAGVDTVIMTNVPYDEREASVWRKAGNLPKGFASALRVDLILTGDWGKLCQAMKKERNSEYGLATGTDLGVATLSGLRKYLEMWAKRMKPQYLMASTPAGFNYLDVNWAQGIDVIESPSGIPTSNELMDKVLVPVAVKLGLPLGIKIGAVRGMNPGLDPCGGGDGLEVASLTFLRVLCLKYPHLRVLATVLSFNNQHELAVLAQKLRNLHIYGCWWYCNNPSMIEGITKMRMEMLGTNFTAQHSDARVLEQLIYKWKHARDAISEAVMTQHRKLIQAGWRVTKGDVADEVRSLLGGSYSAFVDGGAAMRLPGDGSVENLTRAQHDVLGSYSTGAEVVEGASARQTPAPHFGIVRESPRDLLTARDGASPRQLESAMGGGSRGGSTEPSPRNVNGFAHSVATSMFDYEQSSLESHISPKSDRQGNLISPTGRHKQSTASLMHHQPLIPRHSERTRAESNGKGNPVYSQDPSTGAEMPMC